MPLLALGLPQEQVVYCFIYLFIVFLYLLPKFVYGNNEKRLK